ncbi:MAG: hypothetical protein J5588_07920, partial [Bacteroidales bacterium]|nr:hypothetical protein [Bacteroidales bacterium]
METNETHKIGYRCDGYNGADCFGRMNPYNCFDEEIWDMHNTDIIDTVNKLYCGGTDTYLTDFANKTENGDFDDGLVTDDGK